MGNARFRIIPGVTAATYEAIRGGVYTLVVDNSCGAATSNEITVEVNVAPVHILDTMAMSICAGSVAVLTATDASGQLGITHQWYLNDAPIAGAMDLTLSSSLGGVYTMQAINGLTGCSFTTAGVTVNVVTVATPTVTAMDTTTFCVGGVVQLSAQADAAAMYQWFQNDTAITGANTLQLDVDRSGGLFLCNYR